MSDAQTSGFSLLDFDDPADGLLAYAMRPGDMTEEQMAPVWQRFDEAKAAGTKLRLYAEMHGIPSVDSGVVFDKLKRLGTILGTIDRMAIVGDAGWLEFYAKVIDPITKPRIKHFGTADAEVAKAWLRE